MTTNKDILFVHANASSADLREVDFDDKEEIGEIKAILSEGTRFFVLANKKEHRLGFYLFTIDANNPGEKSEYFIRWNNKLDIGDADMYYMEE